MNNDVKESFVCVLCHEVFDKVRSDDEAAEEYKENFPSEDIHDGVEVVCDDCYKDIILPYINRDRN